MTKRLILIFGMVLLAGSAWGFEFGGVDIHGFVSQGYLQSSEYDYNSVPAEEGSFEFNELGINFMTQLGENLRVGAQLYARDLGDIGNDEVDVDWAYGDYRYRNWLGLQVGKMKRPFGLFNQIRDIDAARNCIILPSGVYNERLRESYVSTKGVGIYGSLPGRIEYQAQYGVFAAKPDGGTSNYVETLEPGLDTLSFEIDPGYTLHAMWRTPLRGFNVGASALSYKFSTNVYSPTFSPFLGTIDIYVEGHDYVGFLQYIKEDLMLAAECEWGDFKIDIPQIPRQFTQYRQYKFDPLSYYVMVNYRFAEWFELGAYQSFKYLDKDDQDGDNQLAQGDPAGESFLKDFALTTRFDVTDSWIVKLEGHMMRGFMDAQGYSGITADPNWFLFAAKVTYSF